MSWLVLRDVPIPPHPLSMMLWPLRLAASENPCFGLSTEIREAKVSSHQGYFVLMFFLGWYKVG
jgi:hypothetical protein